MLGAILRSDVDRPEGDRPYTIPRDNPFVGTPGARGEIWSFGHRQVWEFGFDRRGRLWAGEVGQDLWEMIYLVERGGDHGWSVNEGSHPFRPDRKRGPGTFATPLVEHPHSNFRSITGGYAYESDRLPKLKGAYICGDYDSGEVWSLRVDGGKVTDDHQLADTQIRIVEFARDESGEVYLVDIAGGGFHRLIVAPPRAGTRPFPHRLSETGLFKYVLGVTMLQVNKDHDYDESKENQLTVLERLAVFKEKLPQPPGRLPRLVDYQDSREDLNLRSRLPARQLRPLPSQVGRRQCRFRSASHDPARRHEGREHASRPRSFQVGRPAHPGSRPPRTLPRLSTNENGRPGADAARRLLGGGPGGTRHAACMDNRPW